MHRRQFIFSGSAAAGATLFSATACAAEVLRDMALLQPGEPLANGVRPFRIAVPRARLIDLQQRLANTRWPDKETVNDTRQGPPLADVRRLVERWQNGYDWRACEKLLNSLGQHVTQIDGIDIKSASPAHP
jgi:hypothetical protein